MNLTQPQFHKIRVMKSLAICLVGLISFCINSFNEVNARGNPGWGNAALVCDSPRLGGDSPDLSFKGRKPTFETGFYLIGRLPAQKDRYLGVAGDNSETVKLLPSSTHTPTKWLFTQVGSDLYQISTCHNGEPRCLVLPDDEKVRKARIEQCEFEASGSQVWSTQIGILQGPGKGGLELQNDNASRMDCLSEVSDVPILAPCVTSGNPDVTWRVEAANQSVEGSKPVSKKTVKELPIASFPEGADVISYQCESGQTVEAYYGDDHDQVQVSYQGQIFKMDPVSSGSGEKFGGQNLPWGWWIKSEKGFIFKYMKDGTEGEFVEFCVESESVRESVPTTSQDVTPNREWSVSPHTDEVVIMDCRDCGEDIGMMVACKGAIDPALVTLYWAATKQSPSTKILAIDIDGQRFERNASIINLGMLGHVPQFELAQDDPLIAALQNGSDAKVSFDETITTIGLRNSKSIFNTFKSQCGWNEGLRNSIDNPAEEISQAGETNEESMKWFTSEYLDDEKGTSVHNLTLGIPETDAIVFNGTCLSGDNNSSASITILIDVSGLADLSLVHAHMHNNNFDQIYTGQVSTGERGYPGVRLLLAVDDPFWDMVKGSTPISVKTKNQASVMIDALAPANMIDNFLESCG